MTSGNGTGDFPRTLWMLWLQGWENAPELVKRCLCSWQYHNPGWTIRLLDADTLPEWVDLSDFSAAPNEDFLVQSFSNIVRCSLVKTYGGVWVDATCFCLRPLDGWLFNHLRSGFFSFERNGKPCAWFLAAAPGNRAMAAWWDETRAYWIDSPPGLRASLTSPRLVDRAMQRMRLLAWDRLRPKRAVDWPLRTLGKLLAGHPGIHFSPLFRNVLKNAPYYWFHDLFSIYCMKHPEVRRIWDDTPKIRAAGLIELGEFPGLYAPLSDHARRAIDERHTPVYKLNWRLDWEKVGPGCFLDYLFSTLSAPVRNDWQQPQSGIKPDRRLPVDRIRWLNTP